MNFKIKHTHSKVILDFNKKIKNLKYHPLCTHLDLQIKWRIRKSKVTFAILSYLSISSQARALKMFSDILDIVKSLTQEDNQRRIMSRVGAVLLRPTTTPRKQLYLAPVSHPVLLDVKKKERKKRKKKGTHMRTHDITKKN